MGFEKACSESNLWPLELEIHLPPQVHYLQLQSLTMTKNKKTELYRTLRILGTEV